MLLYTLLETLKVSRACLHRVGRKPLVYVGGTLMFLAQVFACIVIATQVHGGHISKQASAGMLVLICTFVAANAFSWGPLGWLVSPAAKLGNTALHAGTKCIGLANHGARMACRPTLHGLLCLQW